MRGAKGKPEPRRARRGGISAKRRTATSRAARPRAKDASFVAFVLEQLEDLGDVRSRAMFGGHGLYRADDFFGIIFDGRLYFRTSGSDRAEYRARGMMPFSPNPEFATRRYWEVPPDVLEDRAEIALWAGRALVASDDAPPRRGSRSRRAVSENLPDD